MSLYKRKYLRPLATVFLLLIVASTLTTGVAASHNPLPATSDSQLEGGVASKPESTPNQTAPPPDQPIEIPELRTRNSKTFLNPDGTYSARIWPGPVHYQDAGGRWQEIDSRLVASSVAGYAFENAANQFKARFAEAGQPNLVRFARGDHWVALTPTGPLSASVPTVTDNRITYAGLLDGIDLEYQVVADGVKENIVLSAPPAQHTSAFQMRHSDGVRLAQQPDDSRDRNLVSWVLPPSCMDLPESSCKDLFIPANRVLLNRRPPVTFRARRRYS